MAELRFDRLRKLAPTLVQTKAHRVDAVRSALDLVDSTGVRQAYVLFASETERRKAITELQALEPVAPTPTPSSGPLLGAAVIVSRLTQ